MSERSSTTLGYEWSTNPYLDRALSRDAFIASILDSVPPRPPYYARMKQLNSDGARPLGGLPGNTSLSLEAFQREHDAGAVVVDLRDQSAFGGAHVPNSFGIGANGNLSGWASWVVPYDTPILLICEPHQQEFAIRSLIRVGLDDVRGRLEGGFSAWREAGLAVRSFPQWTPREGHERLDEGTISVVDVRSADEFRAGHVPGAQWCYLGDLDAAAQRGEWGSEVAVICRTGYRSTVAASVLERNGVTSVFNLTGGMRAWRNAGLPVVSDTGEDPPAAF